jgi:hypothetical protein
MLTTPIGISAVHDAGLLGMQLQLTSSQTLLKLYPQGLGLGLAVAMADDVIRVALERHLGAVPHHPSIEGVVQEQVSQHGANNTPLWRSLVPPHQHPIGHQHVRLQPALDIEQCPSAVRVAAHSLHQEVVIDVVEEPLDVEIEHPVLAPTLVACNAQGIVCRAPWP